MKQIWDIFVKLIIINSILTTDVKAEVTQDQILYVENSNKTLKIINSQEVLTNHDELRENLETGPYDIDQIYGNIATNFFHS